MFTVTTRFIRPPGAVWFIDSSPEHAALNKAFADYQKEAHGFISRVETKSDDGDSYVVAIAWKHVFAVERFLFGHAHIVRKFYSTREAYFAANGISWSCDYPPIINLAKGHGTCGS